MRKGKIQNKECNIRQQVNVITDSVTFTAWKSAKILHWEKIVSLLFKSAWLLYAFEILLNWVIKNVQYFLFVIFQKSKLFSWKIFDYFFGYEKHS